MSEQEGAAESAQTTAPSPDAADEYRAGFDLDDSDDGREAVAAKPEDKDRKPVAAEAEADAKEAEPVEGGDGEVDLETLAEKKGFGVKQRDEQGRFVKQKADEQAAEEAKPAEEAQAKPAQEEKKAAPVATFNFKDYKITDGDVDIGDGRTVNLKEFSEQFPDVPVLICELASQIAERQIAKALESAGFAKREETAGVLNALSARAFWGDVSEEVPKAKSIYESAACKEWLSKQGGGAQRLAAESGDPRDMVMILNNFLSQTKKVNRRAELHSGNLQNRASQAAASAKSAEEEFMEGFNLP